MKRMIALVSLLLMGMLAGCNTIEGIGKDLERGGEKLQDTARDTRQKM